jgi:hypothetical protein
MTMRRKKKKEIRKKTKEKTTSLRNLFFPITSRICHSGQTIALFKNHKDYRTILLHGYEKKNGIVRYE